MKWFVNGILLLFFNVAFPLNPKFFVFHESTSEKFRNFFNGEIAQLDDGKSGSRFIRELNDLMSKVVTLDVGIKNVTICDTAGEASTAFTPNIDPSDYDVNGVPLFAKLKQNGGLFLNINAAVSQLGDCHYINTPVQKGFFVRSSCLCKAKKLCSLDVVDVYPEYTPYFVVIAHELIHLKHFLETIVHYCYSAPQYVPLQGEGKAHSIDDEFIGYGSALKIRSYEDIETLSPNKKQAMGILHEALEKDELGKLCAQKSIKKFKTHVMGLKRDLPWPDFEERRTVFGGINEKYSELSIRVEHGLPIRYPYTEVNSGFCELKEIICKIMQDSLPSLFSDENAVDAYLSKLAPNYIISGTLDSEIEWNWIPLKVRLALRYNNALLRNMPDTMKKIRDYFSIPENQSNDRLVPISPKSPLKTPRYDTGELDPFPNSSDLNTPTKVKKESPFSGKGESNSSKKSARSNLATPRQKQLTNTPPSKKVVSSSATPKALDSVSSDTSEEKKADPNSLSK